VSQIASFETGGKTSREVAKHPGIETSRWRTVQVAKRPGSEASKVVANRPGGELAKKRNVQQQ